MKRLFLCFLLISSSFVLGCKDKVVTVGPPAPAAPISPHEAKDAIDVFLTKLRKGMTEVEFDELLSRSQFNNGFIGLPIIVSLSDPNRHFNFPSGEPYTFVFDAERKLQKWLPWSRGEAGGYSYKNEGIGATLETTE